LCRSDPEDEVIIPAMTFVSTAMAFLFAGFRVRLADVDLETLLLTKDSVEQAVTSKTRGVVVVHLYGQRAPIPTEDKRKIVEALIEKIVIGEGEIDITFSHIPSSEELCKSQQKLGLG
jgi:dTDP-4-amino-4,6-dideoxygalactose transaminase